MKYPILPILVVLGALCGCQSEPQPAPGLAALRVKVMAEPKNGVSPAHPSVYDQPAGLGSGAFERVDYSNLADIVVWIEDASGKSASHEMPKPVVVDANATAAGTGLTAAACVGQTVVFRNGDVSPVNLYSVSDGNEFNLGKMAPSAQASYLVKSPGVIEVLSSGLLEPVARIYAAPVGPVFLTHSGATLNVTDLTPGQYTVVSWHPRLPGSAIQMNLTADHVSHGTIGVGVNGLPKVDSK